MEIWSVQIVTFTGDGIIFCIDSFNLITVSVILLSLIMIKHSIQARQPPLSPSSDYQLSICTHMATGVEGVGLLISRSENRLCITTRTGSALAIFCFDWISLNICDWIFLHIIALFVTIYSVTYDIGTNKPFIIIIIIIILATSITFKESHSDHFY